MRIASRCFSSPLALTFVLAAGAIAQAPARGTIVGIVTAKETGTPLPYADVFVEGTRSGAFVDVNGRFRVSGLPAGEIRIRVRRLGFTPALVSVNVRAGETDTLRVALAALAIQLERVSVKDNVCPNAKPSSDTNVVAILQQVQMNAERTALLARQLPFYGVFERTMADEGAQPGLFGGGTRRSNVHVDTLERPGEHDWVYAPGNLIEASESQDSKHPTATMKIPQLVDFAEDAFVAAHCFRFAGLATIDGRRTIRIEFEPTREVKKADVRGSLYLDTASYQIVRSTLYSEVPSLAKAGDTWNVRVETWFREALPALPVIERICQRTETVGTSQGRPRGAALEMQRLLELRFNDRAPPGFTPVVGAPMKNCPAA